MLTRSFRRTATVSAAVATILFALATPAQAATYRMYNLIGPSWCLDADTTGNGANGSKIQVWTCNFQSNQEWRFEQTNTPDYVTIVNVRYNKCLDLDTSNLPVQNGEKVHLWQCTGNANQRWKLTGPSTTSFFLSSLQVPNSFFVLDADVSGGIVAGMKVNMWSDRATANQRWCIVCR